MKKVNLADQLRFCQLVAELLNAGFSLNQALVYLSAAMPKYKNHWQALQQQLSSGVELAISLDQAHFHPLIVQQVTLAQQHGQLAESLAHAGEYLHLQVTNRRKLKQLMVYPSVLMGLLVSLQLVLWLGVLPSLQMQTTANNWVPMAAVVGSVIAGFTIWWVVKRLPATTRYQVSQLIPVVRGLVNDYYRYQFAVGASHFLTAGLALSAYCELLAGLSDSVLAATGQAVVAQLAAGASPQQALQQRLIYPPIAELVGLGQAQPLVARGVALFAQALFARLNQRFEQVMALVQPVLFLVIGAQIVLVYMGMLGPLYNSVNQY
ncbi:type II secretion system F family protein [Lacticaseibacillus sp. N501-2]|uniref:type II secretion system F family protein n=1 Tax=Lacticaseibacillus salsurae TaxID=3367729 RepID=UPI0038B28C31